MDETLDDYLYEVINKYEREGDWRLGQTYFNVLTEFNPRLAEQVRGSALDPFYQDIRIVEFLAFVGENWRESK